MPRRPNVRPLHTIFWQRLDRSAPTAGGRERICHPRRRKAAPPTQRGLLGAGVCPYQVWAPVLQKCGRDPTADSAALVQAAHLELRQIYQTGDQLIKAGVMSLDLEADDSHQGELNLIDCSADACTCSSTPDRNRDKARLMAALDGLNGRFGKGTVQVASSGVADHRQIWGMQQERPTPHYTTKWDEVAVVRA